MRRIAHALTLAVLVGLLGAFTASPGRAASPATPGSTTFSGQATVVKGKVLGITIPCIVGPAGCSGLVDTGPVAAEGGDLEQNLVCYPQAPNCTLGVPDMTSGALQATVLHAAVVSHGSKSRAEATVSYVALNAAGHSVQATFLNAEAEASCSGNTASVSGSAEVVGLTIDNQSVVVSGQANQRIDIPGSLGFVIVNEQTASVSADHGDITVSALHIVVPGLIPGTDTDVYVAQAHADIACGARPAGCPGDRVTGGGWFYWPASPDRVHFALAARNGIDTWGHLLYMAKAGDLMVRGAPAAAELAWTSGNDGSGTVEGTAQANRQFAGQNVGYFVVHFVDAGEPGSGDKFAITLLTQRNGTVLYEANASLALTLDGGNLQYHHCR